MNMCRIMLKETTEANPWMSISTEHKQTWNSTAYVCFKISGFRPANYIHIFTAYNNKLKWNHYIYISHFVPRQWAFSDEGPVSVGTIQTMRRRAMHRDPPSSIHTWGFKACFMFKLYLEHILIDDWWLVNLSVWQNCPLKNLCMHFTHIHVYTVQCAMLKYVVGYR